MNIFAYFFFFYYEIFVSGTDYYVDNSLEIFSNNNGSKANPFGIFDDAINIFANKSSLGNNTIFLVSNENDSCYFSNETLIEIKDGTHIFLQK